MQRLGLEVCTRPRSCGIVRNGGGDYGSYRTPSTTCVPELGCRLPQRKQTEMGHGLTVSPPASGLCVHQGVRCCHGIGLANDT